MSEVSRFGRVVEEVAREFGRERRRLMDIARGVQQRLGRANSQAVDAIASWLGISRVEVEGFVTFYSFLSTEPKGRVVIRLCDDVIDRMAGYDEVRRGFEAALGYLVGETTPDGCSRWNARRASACATRGLLGRQRRGAWRSPTSRATSAEHRAALCENPRPSAWCSDSARGRMRTVGWLMVENNLRKAGPIVFSEQSRGEAIRKAVAIRPAEVIRAVKTARSRRRRRRGSPRA